MDLSFITTAPAPAPAASGRSPQGTGQPAAADAASFVDRLAAIAALAAAIDGRGAAAPADAAELAEGDAEMDEAASDSTAAIGLVPTFVSPTVGATLPPAAAAMPSADPMPADADVRTGEGAATGSAAATNPSWFGPAVIPEPPAVPTQQRSAPVPERPATVPSDPGPSAPAVPSLPTQTAGHPPNGHPLAGQPEGQPAAASTGSIDPQQSRPDVAGLAAPETRPGSFASTFSEAAAGQASAERVERDRPSHARAALPTGAPPVEVPAAPPAATPHGSAMPAVALAAPSSGGRTGTDGDSPASFAFAGHAVPRLMTPPAPGPSPVATFSDLITAGSAPESLPPATATQIVQSIRMQMLRDGGEAHIRLDPRQFGDMTVRIKVDQGQVTARVEADAPVVREWLQGNQHVLRQSLAGQQLTLDRLEVHEPPASSPGRRDDTSAREDARHEQRQQQRRRRADAGDRFEVVA